MDLLPLLQLIAEPSNHGLEPWDVLRDGAVNNRELHFQMRFLVPRVEQQAASATPLQRHVDICVFVYWRRSTPTIDHEVS
jgi:hypothetical protein